MVRSRCHVETSGPAGLLTGGKARRILRGQIELYQSSPGSGCSSIRALCILGLTFQRQPLTRYLRETSMIFTTRVAKAMQSIAIAIAD